MYMNVLNAHGQQITVHPKHIFHRGKQRLCRPRGNDDSRRGWAGITCAPLKFVKISKSIFSLWFYLAAVVCVVCVAYFAVEPKNSVLLNYAVAVILTLCLLYILFVLFCKVKDETIVLLPSVGIQLQKCYAIGRNSIQFIPYDVVKDVVVNEAISMYKVVYYIVVLINSPTYAAQTSVIPLFTHSLPRLDILCVIYNVCQEALQIHHQENIQP